MIVEMYLDIKTMKVLDEILDSFSQEKLTSDTSYGNIVKDTKYTIWHRLQTIFPRHILNASYIYSTGKPV